MTPGSPSVVVSETTKSLSAFLKLVYFFSSGGWLSKCLVLAAA